MKKVLFLFLLTVATTFAQTDVMKFKGKIANKNSDAITLTGPGFKHTIPVDKDGKFSDSFSVTPGIYEFFDGSEYTEIYLKNGLDLKLTMDAKNFDESIVYKGKGAKENNILAKKILDEEALEPKIVAAQNNQQEVMKLFTDFRNSFNSQMEAPGIDPGLKVAYEAKLKADQEKQQKMQAELMKKQAASDKLTGSVSPTFVYENHKGGKTSLEELRGKYVYIDTWATWCGPCRAEIPFLQKTEEKYKGKNIEFVSISVDLPKDYDKWKKMVSEKNLGGIQLIADNNWNSDFIRAYGINSIPRFILIGPDGKVISANADRPSSPNLVPMLDKLLN
ncbi:MAG TPA: TlpA disulfide reductase family protein [Flavobacterium sp.]|jgi:thiol-disulfide isomerase/thioredoxin